MPIDARSFVQKYGTRTISYAVGIGLAVLLLILAVGSAGDTVSNTQVAIVVNNVTGEISTFKDGGMVLHLPFGLSTVKTLDKSPKVMRLSRETRSKEHPEGDQVKIKTNDGSNVEADIEIVYQVDVANAYVAYRELFEDKDVNAEEGKPNPRETESMDAILRAVVRAEVRNKLGELDTAEIVDPATRNSKVYETQRFLADYFKPMGLEIVSVNAQNFHFNEEYEKIVRQRKSAEQILINQKDFQRTKQKVRDRMIAEINKERSNSLAQLQGELKKRVLTAEGESKRVITKALQEAYQLDREGEIALANAKQEAAAIVFEGEQKAQATAKLFDAYEQGGEGLVREALVKLYEGVNLTARPYSPSERIDQIRALPFLPETAPPKVVTPPVITPAMKGGK